MSASCSSAFEEFEEFIDGEGGFLDESYTRRLSVVALRSAAYRPTCRERLIRLPENVHHAPPLTVLW